MGDVIKCKVVSTKEVEGKIVEYTIEDTKGGKISATPEKIAAVMSAGKIELEGFTVNSEGKLVKLSTNVSNSNSNSLGASTDMDRMKYLVGLLNKASKAYYVDSKEIMSNYEYDKLYDELVKLEAKLGTVLASSPTINVGYEVVSELPKERHTEKMLSLAKTKSIDEIVGFGGVHDVLIGWKLDGLTVVVTYMGGKLVKAVTRGNGEVGELVTNNAMHFVNLPREISWKGKLVIRGEATITYSDFEKINAGLVGEEKYKNPRNLASGSVRQLDSKVTAGRFVRFTAFNLVEMIDEAGNKREPAKVSSSYKEMASLGFDVVDWVVVRGEVIRQAIKEWSDKVSSGKLNQPVDGLVITYDNVSYGKSLGQTAKTPRHSIAFKWEDETKETKLVDIEWSASKTGLLNPVAIFEPVELEGTTVSRASLHNVSVLVDTLGQPYIGQKIRVYKANMIIPCIEWGEKVQNPSNKLFAPSWCPVCEGDTEVHKDSNSGVLTLWCTNPDCGAKENRLLKHFVTRDAMNIDGISGATLETLCEYGIVDSFSSVFKIGNHPEIMDIEGFGEKSFYNMVKSVDKARNVKLANLIYALSIPNVGLATAKLICENFGNDLVKTVNASYSDIVSIKGIGDVIATSFTDYFEDEDNREEFRALVKELNIIKEEVVKADSADLMFGKTFCVTGSASPFTSRRIIEEIITSRGGKLTKSVSGSTNYLITNDTTSGSKKNMDAKKYGTSIKSVREFIRDFNVDTSNYELVD